MPTKKLTKIQNEQLPIFGKEILDTDVDSRICQNFNNENQCRICKLELNEKDFKLLKQCEFCTL